MKKLLVLFSFSFIFSTSHGQDYHKIDSLKKVLVTIPELSGNDQDVPRILLCQDIGYYYENSFPDSALFWYGLVADTIFDENKINAYPLLAGANAKTLRYMGYVGWNKGNYPYSSNYYHKALNIARLIGDKQETSNCLLNLGNVAWFQGQLSSAISFYKQALDIYNDLGDLSGSSNCLLNMGSVARTRGDNPAAISYYENALKNFSSINDLRGISNTLGNMGIISRNQGKYPQAISYYQKALKIFEELDDQLKISKTYTNLGVVAIYQGNYHASLKYYERALKIKLALSDKPGISACLMNMGLASQYLGNDSLAERFYKESLAIDEEQEDLSGVSRCLTNLGVLAKEQGNYSLAFDYYEKALAIAEKIDDKQTISACLLNIGNIQKILGNYPLAINYIEKSLKIKEDLQDKAGLAEDYASLAIIYNLTGKPEISSSLLLKSEMIILTLLQDNFTLLSEREKTLYLDKTKSVFNDIHSVAFSNPSLNDSLLFVCFNNELILKGLLLKSTQDMLSTVFASSDTIVKNTYLMLKQCRNKVAELQGSIEKNRDSLIIINEILADERERELVKLSAEYSSMQRLFDYKWQDIQKKLKPGEAAIEFLFFDQGGNKDSTVYAALLLTYNKKPIPVKLFTGDQIKKTLLKYDNADNKTISQLYGTRQTINCELYDLIWSPLEKHLFGIKNIYFAPAGILNKISFSALGAGKQALCDRYNLYQLGSTGKLIYSDQYAFNRISNIVLFGGIDYNTDTLADLSELTEPWPFLPGTFEEKECLEILMKKYNIPTLGYSGKYAKEEEFKKLFVETNDNPCILHIATHGFFYQDPQTQRIENKDLTIRNGVSEYGSVNFRGTTGYGTWQYVNNKNPMMRSGLVLTGANRVWSEDQSKNEDDGILTAHEISQLNMRNTDLVVLSACETGLGDIKGSEGVYGLQRAFKMAGVKYIIMSLWQVPDKETVEFMEMFYKKLLKIKDVRIAFTQTQKEMRKKYDPYYWASFVLIE